MQEKLQDISYQHESNQDPEKYEKNMIETVNDMEFDVDTARESGILELQKGSFLVRQGEDLDESLMVIQ